MSAAALEAHFAKQLQAADWRRLDGRSDGPLCWSTWKVAGDNDMQALLYAFEGPVPHQRDLLVQVTSSSAAVRGSMQGENVFWSEGTELVLPAPTPTRTR